nr:uncharacterized protein LOC127489900 [Oryctolagus cuniculus]
MNVETPWVLATLGLAARSQAPTAFCELSSPQGLPAPKPTPASAAPPHPAPPLAPQSAAPATPRAPPRTQPGPILALSGTGPAPRPQSRPQPRPRLRLSCSACPVRLLRDCQLHRDLCAGGVAPRNQGAPVDPGVGMPAPSRCRRPWGQNRSAASLAEAPLRCTRVSPSTLLVVSADPQSLPANAQHLE